MWEFIVFLILIMLVFWYLDSKLEELTSKHYALVDTLNRFKDKNYLQVADLKQLQNIVDKTADEISKDLEKWKLESNKKLEIIKQDHTEHRNVILHHNHIVEGYLMTLNKLVEKLTK